MTTKWIVGWAALALALVAAGCGDDTSDTTSTTTTASGSGGAAASSSSAGGQGGSDACAMGEPYDGSSCDCCKDDEVCELTQAVLTFYTCDPMVTVGPNQFLCGSNTACDNDQVCEIRTPLGDGSTVESCETMPAACAASPSCTCLEMEIANVTSCSEESGTFTVTGPNI